MPVPGDTAPDFTLPRDGGGDLTLSSLRPGKVVLYFYAQDDSGSCRNEAEAFSARATDFAAAGASVIGLSRDGVKSHDRFIAKRGLNLTLVSDEDGKVCEAWGVWVEKSMYGRTYMGVERATFLIDGSGRIARAWRNVRVKGHAEEVLEAARAL